MVPAVELPPAIPATDHLTSALAGPVTCTENCSAAPAVTVGLAGMMAML
jgi:hypothetical protein